MEPSLLSKPYWPEEGAVSQGKEGDPPEMQEASWGWGVRGVSGDV